jgi:hypothetical protein
LLGDLLQQVHGVADIAVVTLQLAFGFAVHQERFTLRAVSHLLRGFRLRMN